MKNSAMVLTEDNTVAMPPEAVNRHLRTLKDEGFRFVTMSCTDLGEDLELLYHLDKDLEVINLEVTVPKRKRLLSSSSVYYAAFLVENEIKEQFGLEFDGLPLDFQGMLYLDEEVMRTPFCKLEIRRKQEG